MRNLIFAGAAAIACTAVPAIAQDVAVDADGTGYVLTDEQQTMSRALAARPTISQWIGPTARSRRKSCAANSVAPMISLSWP